MVCQEGAPINGAIHELFSHLGRDFYDPSLIDAKGNWTRNDDGDQVAADSTYRSKPTSDPNVVAIHEITKVEPRGHEMGSGWTDELDITYNVALSVPVTLHSVSTPDSRNDNGGVEITDMKRDSFAKK